MASFRKFGGISRIKKTVAAGSLEMQNNNTTATMLSPKIITSHEWTYSPLLVTDALGGDYFKDTGLVYAYNQTVGDYALNVDHISATTLFNVSSITFADGSSMFSAPSYFYSNYSVCGSSDGIVNFSSNIVLPECGVYVITFCFNAVIEEDFKSVEIFSHDGGESGRVLFSFASSSGIFTVKYISEFTEFPSSSNVYDNDDGSISSPCLFFRLTDCCHLSSNLKGNVSVARIA